MSKTVYTPFKVLLCQKDSPEIALQKAYKVLNFVVTKQGTVRSYMDVFLYLGILFLICIPFILLIKKGKKKVDVSAAMH